MSLTTFKVSVDEVFFDFQREKTGSFDNDWLTLTVTTKNNGHTQSVPAYQLNDLITSGSLVQDMLPPIEMPGLALADDDELLITVSIMNRSHDDALAHALADASALIGTLGLIVFTGGEINTVDVAIEEGKIEGAIAGAVLAVAKWFESADCDGFVFNRSYFRSVEQLLQDTQQISGRSFIFPMDPYTEKNSKGCGHDPVTRIKLSVTLTNQNPDFQGLPPGSLPPPGEPVSVKSLSGAPAFAWSGQWVDLKSKVFCTVGVVQPQPIAAVASKRVSLAERAMLSGITTMPLVFGHLGTDINARSLASADALPATPPRGSSASAPSVLGLVPHFVIDIEEIAPAFVGQQTITTSSTFAFSLPMLVPPRTGDRYAPSPRLSSLVVANVSNRIQKSPALRARSESAAGGKIHSVVGGETSGPSQIATPLAAFELAATIAVSETVFLQLYGAYDVNGRFVEHHIRYLRNNPDGNTIVDVMLAPVNTIK